MKDTINLNVILSECPIIKELQKFIDTIRMYCKEHHTNYTPELDYAAYKLLESIVENEYKCKYRTITQWEDSYPKYELMRRYNALISVRGTNEESEKFYELHWVHRERWAEENILEPKRKN